MRHFCKTKLHCTIANAFILLSLVVALSIASDLALAGRAGGGDSPVSFIVGQPGGLGPGDLPLSPATGEPTGNDGARPEHSMRSSHAVCVRLCDGSFFPLSGAGGGDSEAACARQCRQAPTAVYFLSSGSDQIDNAIASDGRPYTALPTAFHYRSSVAPTCSCGSKDESENTNALLADPSLRKGDLIMTADGIREFRGASTMPYESTDFISIAQSSVPRAQREELMQIDREAAHGNGMVTGAKLGLSLPRP
jgi:Protein of unknown function (DUF2865)